MQKMAVISKRDRRRRKSESLLGLTTLLLGILCFLAGLGMIVALVRFAIG